MKNSSSLPPSNFESLSQRRIKDCLKEGLVDADSKSFRIGVLEGLKGEKRNAVARVAAELVQDTSLNGE